MIIGVTGKICSGHDSVGKILTERGFNRFSLSDKLREIMTAEGIEINRESMRNFGDRLRLEEGAGFLAMEVIKDLNGDCVIESIRNPGEVEELRKMKGFVLLTVDASAESRFERLLKRGRDEDEPKTFEEFVEWEKRDLGIGQPKHGLQQNKCIEMADFRIVNDGSLEDLRVKVGEFLKEDRS